MSFSSQEQEKKIASLQEPRKFGKDLYKMCTKEPQWVEHNLINFIRNSSPDSQVHTRVEYTVKKEAIPDVLKHIVDFIDTVRDSESGIKVYESYQNVQYPNQFFHLAEFQDKDAEQIHKDAPHTKKFADFLYPLCEKEPEFIYMTMVGSARR